MFFSSVKTSVFLLAALLVIHVDYAYGYSLNATNNLGPNVRLLITPTLEWNQIETLALFEGGPQTARANGTVSYNITPQHKIKIGGEYLVERLKYNFNSNETREGAGQFALGAKYEYKTCFDFLEFEAGGSYSQASHHHLNPKIVDDEVIFRRIGGSNIGQFHIGAAFIPFDSCCIPYERTILFVGVCYDYAKFDHLFYEKKMKGSGVIFAWTQGVTPNIDFTLRGEIRHLYGLAEAMLMWHNPFRCENWDAGFYVDYVSGNQGISRSMVVGIQLSYDFSGENCKLLQWSRLPAFYKPIVLTFSDYHKQQQ